MTDNEMRRFFNKVHTLTRGNDSIQERWYREEPDVYMSKVRRKQLKKMGFLPSSDIVFDFDRYGYENYVNFRDYRKLHPINGIFSKLIDNKSFIPILFRSKPNYLPEFFGTIEKGKLSNCNLGNFSTIDGGLKSGIEKHGALFLKQRGEAGGRGALVLNEHNLRDGLNRITESGLTYYFSNYLRNEKFLENIYAPTLNTVRALFYKNVKGEIDIIKMFMRFGTKQSHPVDNGSAGGMVFTVNKGTGKIGHGRIYSDKNVYDSHIDSGKKISGTIIPGWKRKIHSINEILTDLNFLRWGGLDIAFTDTGIKILEVNSLPGLRISQIDEPLLLKKEVKEFFLCIGYGSQ
jgi:hypothetical protein